MTRIVAGTAGGRTLRVPRSGTRPTSERVREALFSRLEHLDAVDDARVLDLYAGSGALGLEAASRGARDVVLVEASREAAEVCRANARTLGLAGRVRVAAERVERWLAHGEEGFDLVLADPPYDVRDDDLAGVLAGVAGVVAPHAVVVVERSTRSPEPAWPQAVEGRPGLVRTDERRYGETRVWFAEPVAP
jgi:16S rRNA (guanine966-N2)-methyltransferase